MTAETLVLLPILECLACEQGKQIIRIMDTSSSWLQPSHRHAASLRRQQSLLQLMHVHSSASIYGRLMGPVGRRFAARSRGQVSGHDAAGSNHAGPRTGRRAGPGGSSSPGGCGSKQHKQHTGEAWPARCPLPDNEGIALLKEQMAYICHVIVKVAADQAKEGMTVGCL